MPVKDQQAQGIVCCCWVAISMYYTRPAPHMFRLCILTQNQGFSDYSIVCFGEPFGALYSSTTSDIKN